MIANLKNFLVGTNTPQPPSANSWFLKFEAQASLARVCQSQEQILIKSALVTFKQSQSDPWGYTLILKDLSETKRRGSSTGREQFVVFQVSKDLELKMDVKEETERVCFEFTPDQSSVFMLEL
jgi:hypothetical protein